MKGIWKIRFRRCETAWRRFKTYCDEENSVLYRRFGKTNLQMPFFSCGGMRYQHKWNDVPLSEVPPDNQANLEATIRRSVELGINHIETARGYGSSERQLGLILPKF